MRGDEAIIFTGEGRRGVLVSFILAGLGGRVGGRKGIMR